MNEENKPPTAAPLHGIVLLPCPFCGGEAEECYQRDDLDDWKIECSGCGAVSCPDGMRYDKHLAIKDWNTRIVKGVRAVFSYEMFGKIGFVWMARTGGEMYGPCLSLDELYSDLGQ
jgi:Lar family restriction alleviation protein